MHHNVWHHVSRTSPRLNLHQLYAGRIPCFGPQNRTTYHHYTHIALASASYRYEHTSTHRRGESTISANATTVAAQRSLAHHARTHGTSFHSRHQCENITGGRTAILRKRHELWSARFSWTRRLRRHIHIDDKRMLSSRWSCVRNAPLSSSSYRKAPCPHSRYLGCRTTCESASPLEERHFHRRTTFVGARSCAHSNSRCASPFVGTSLRPTRHF